MDTDGYGYKPDDRGVKLLLEDIRGRATQIPRYACLT
jgi:hypothetical protein